MEVFTEKEEQAQQLTGRCPSLQETTIEDLITLGLFFGVRGSLLPDCRALRPSPLGRRLPQSHLVPEA